MNNILNIILFCLLFTYYSKADLKPDQYGRSLISLHIFHADSTPAKYTHVSKIVPSGKHLAQRYLDRYEYFNQKDNNFEFKLAEGKYDYKIKHENNKEKIITLNISKNQILDTNIYFDFKENEYSPYSDDQYIFGYNPSRSQNIYGFCLNWDNFLESPYTQNIYGITLTLFDFYNPIGYPEERGKNRYGLALGLFENSRDTLYTVSLNLINSNWVQKYLNISLLYSKINYFTGINISPYNACARTKYLNISLVNNNYESAGLTFGLYNEATIHRGVILGVINNANSSVAIGLLSYSYLMGINLVNFGSGLNIGAVNIGGSSNIGIINYNNTGYKHKLQSPSDFFGTYLNLGLINYMNYKGNLFLSTSFYNQFYDNYALMLGLVNNSVTNSGLQIGLLNISEDDSGIQLGLLNINNSRWMPIINW